jgi:hypothetical protein
MTYSVENLGLKRANPDIEDFVSGFVDMDLSEAYSNLFFPYILDHGGSKNQTSIHIDILDNENESGNFQFSILDNKKRFQGDLLKNEIKWRFIETTHVSKNESNISNAFCFSGQKIKFKINTENNICGLIGDTFVYSRMNFKLSVIDLFRGNKNVLKSFNHFDLDIDDDSRSFIWEVPEIHPYIDDYSLFGIFVLKIEVSYDFYEDENFGKPVEINYPKSSESFLHLLTYSFANEAKNVSADNITLFEEALNGNESYNEIFDKSVFKQYENENILTDDHKRAIISDQIAVLFMSQHPVVTSEMYPAPILGLGGTEQTLKNTVLKNPLIYSRKYPEIIPMVENRMFNLILNYQMHSYSYEIEENFSNNGQSLQKTYDPQTSYVIDEKGNLKTENGVDGILFNPYVVENIHSEITNLFEYEKDYSINLTNNSVGISNIRILNEFDEEITKSTKSVNIYFDVDYGNELIKRIKYSIWTQNSLSYKKHIDENGQSRSHNFDLSSQGGIEITYLNNELYLGDIVNIEILIEDVYGKVNPFFYSFALPENLYFPYIKDFSCRQRPDGSGFVDIKYSYQGGSEKNNSNVNLYYSLDNSSWNLISDDIYGDVGLNINPGIKYISWNVKDLIENMGYSELLLYLKIGLQDIDQKYDKGKWGFYSKSTYVSLSVPKIDLMKVSKEEMDELFVSSSSSESSSSSFSSFSSLSSSSSSFSSFSSSSSSSSLNDSPLVKAMTSNVDHPFDVSDNSFFGGGLELPNMYIIFDRAGGFVTNLGYASFTIDMGTEYLINAYSIFQNGSSTNDSPRSWVVYGGYDSDNVNTVIHSVTYTGWQADTETVFTVSPEYPYRYYKFIFISKMVGSGITNLQLGQMQLYGEKQEMSSSSSSNSSSSSSSLGISSSSSSIDSSSSSSIDSSSSSSIDSSSSSSSSSLRTSSSSSIDSSSSSSSTGGEEVFAFAVTSDPRGSHEDFRTAVQRLNEFTPQSGDFHISLGDIDLDIPENRAIIDDELGSDFTWIPLIGNHEAETPSDVAWLRDEYDNGQGGTRTSLKSLTNEDGPATAIQTQYSFDYGDIRFIVINPYWDGFYDDASNEGVIIQEHLDWIEPIIQDARLNGKQVIVMGHEPAFNNNRKVNLCLDRDHTTRDAFWEMLEDNKVLAYFCGHSHIFNAYKPNNEVSGLNDWDHENAWDYGENETWQVEFGIAGNDFLNNPNEGYTASLVKVYSDKITVFVHKDDDKNNIWKLDNKFDILFR